MSSLSIQEQIKEHTIYLDGNLFSIQEAYNALQRKSCNRTAAVKISTNRVAQVLGEMVNDGLLFKTERGGNGLYSSPAKARTLINHAWVPQCFEGNWIGIGNNAE